MYIEQKTFARISLNRTAVLFLHAFPVNHAMWAPQMNFLASRGMPVVTLDYPGFGDSAPFTTPPTIDAYARQALDVLDESGVSNAVVVGLSMGGYVALALYRLAPERFGGLVLADTRASADTEEGRQRRFQLIENIERTGDIDPIIQGHIEKFFTPDHQQNTDLVTTARRLMQRATNTGIIHALHAMAHRPDSMELLSQMHFPVEVIVGESDSLTTVEDSRKMVEQLPQGHLTVIPKAAHLSNLEQPEAFNRALEAYLQKLGLL